VFPIFQHGTATTMHTCAGFSLILYYIRRLKKPEYEISMAYTFPLLNLTETDSFTKFCTKYLSHSNQTRERTGSGSVAKTKRCRYTRARQILLNNSEHARSVSMYSNKHNEGSSTKNRIQPYGNCYGPRSVQNIHNITHRTLLPCGELYYMKKCYAVYAALPVGSVFN